MEKSKILVVDDEEVVRDLLLKRLERRSYHVETAEDGNIALEKIRVSFFNLIMTDLKMPKVDGMEVLKKIKEINPYIEVIIITGYPTIESAVGAIKIGAFDFICKPFDLEGLESTVIRCLERQKFTINHIELGELMTLFEVSKIIASTTGLNSVLELILDSALGVVKAKRGSLLLLDEDTKELSIKVARGLSDEVINNTRIRPGEGICWKAVQEGKPLLVNDINEDARFKRENNPQYETKSFLSIPLVNKSLYSQENVLGVINITDKISGDNFTEREQTLLSVLASQAVAVIENYKLYSQLQDKIALLERTIQELNKTQNHLIQTEKMAAVGQLAFGIAHEIRNPLGIILGGVEFLKCNVVNKNEVIAMSVEKIKQSIERANNIIIDLLKFSRIPQLGFQPVNVCQIMDEAVSLIKNQAYLNNVRINRDYMENDLQLKADANLLRQTFFNLCINAIEAMPRGGELSLNIYSLQNGEQNESNVIIEIADTGKGIPEDILPQIFDPFFTTKEPGKGTGLGLSIVHTILKRHNATINAESKVNAGTKFIIKFPMERNSNSCRKRTTQNTQRAQEEVW